MKYKMGTFCDVCDSTDIDGYGIPPMWDRLCRSCGRIWLYPNVIRNRVYSVKRTGKWWQFWKREIVIKDRVRNGKDS